MLLDTRTIEPALQGRLFLSNKLSLQAQRVTSLPEIKGSLLISLGQLCDDNCTIVIDNIKMLAIKEDELILRGHRNYLDELWDIPIGKTRIQSEKYNVPLHHGLQYRQVTNNVKKNVTEKTTETKKKDYFFPIFSGLNELIEVNECEHLCNTQQKQMHDNTRWRA